MKLYYLPMYTAIVFGVLLVHGLQLINDGIYWDGWIYYTHLKDKNWDLLYKPFRDAGYPLQAYMMRYIAGFGDITFSHRIASLISIAFSGICIFRIGCESRRISEQNSLAIALLSIAYPVFQTALAINIVPILVSYAMFFFGVLLALRSERFDRWKHYSLRVSALLAFVISFVWRSFLVFYFGFLFLLLMIWLQEKDRSLKNIFRFILYHFDYLLLPFAYWILNGILFSGSGLYSTDNKFLSSPVAISVSFAKTVYFGIFRQLLRAMTELIAHPFVWFLFTLIILLAMRFSPSRKRDARINNLSLVSGLGLLGFGLALLVLGIFPYAVVGKSATLNDFASRHSLLVALPLAVIFVAFQEIVFQKSKGFYQKVGWLMVGTLWLGFALASTTDYLSWQTRWIKDRSIIAKLSDGREFKNFSIYWVDDRFPAGNEYTYRFYEWASMFKLVWGDESRIGLDYHLFTSYPLGNLRPHFNRDYLLSELDPAGSQALLVINKGRSVSGDMDLSLRYFYYRFLYPDQLSGFLSGVADIRIRAIYAPKAIIDEIECIGDPTAQSFFRFPRSGRENDKI